MSNDRTADHLNMLCSIHERNIRVLMAQVAHFGLGAPAHLVVELEKEVRLLEHTARTVTQDFSVLIGAAYALLQSNGGAAASESTVRPSSPTEGEQRESSSFQFNAFVCYARRDMDAVISLKGSLERASVRLWIDFEQIQPGHVVTESIELGLRSSAKLLACLSKNTKKSSWVRAEYGAILKREVDAPSGRLIPVVIGELEDGDIPLLLANLHRLDARTSAGLGALIRCLRD